jgi:hypothetical protein
VCRQGGSLQEKLLREAERIPATHGARGWTVPGSAVRMQSAVGMNLQF